MVVVFERVLLLILFAMTGFVLCRKGVADHKQAKLLSVLEVYLFLPANTIKTYSANFTVEYFQGNYDLIVASAVILLVVAILADIIAKWLTNDPYTRNVYRYSLIFSNYGFIGYALTADLFGDLMLQNVMVFAFPIGMCVYTFGFSKLTKTGLNLKKLLNPVILSIFVGALIGLSGIRVPSILASMLDKASACMSPVSMLLAGMVISEFDIKTLLGKRNNYIVALFRLILFPCAIAGILAVLGLDDILIPALMMYAMPCGLNTIVFPRLVGEDCEPGASLALISSLLACITIPICVSIFT